MKKTTQLRNLINSQKPEFIMEAHNGLSAKIVEETGFKGIWASGLSISAALGVRDNNEASWTQVLEVCEFMSDASSIPILLDGDTGFGNFNSFRRLIYKLEQRGIAGVCIEDKIFPKTNSFIGGEKQPLAEIDEFCGKIRAGKDSQIDPDFVIVARVEAFIAGWGIEEALRRANAYADAGADALLIHSKINSYEEIESFMERWNNKKPVIIVPTMYYKTPTQKFAESGIALVIWANHSMRASITKIQEVVKQIYNDESLINVENNIVPVKEVFRLQNAKEYKQAEERYLPQKKSYKGLILAASKGSNFGTLTDDKPKAMIKIGDESILEKLITTFNNRRIKDISVVVGYKKETVNLPNLKYIENDKYDEYGILYSLYAALDAMDSDIVISFGDILFEEDVLRKLIITQEDILIAVDAKKKINVESEKDLVESTQKYSKKFGAVSVHPVLKIQEVTKGEDTSAFHGEFMGLMKLSDKGAEIFRTELKKLYEENQDFILKGSLTDFLNYLIEKEHPVMLEYFKGHWKDIDSIEDLTYLINYFSKENPE